MKREFSGSVRAYLVPIVVGLVLALFLIANSVVSNGISGKFVWNPFASPSTAGQAQGVQPASTGQFGAPSPAAAPPTLNQQPQVQQIEPYCEPAKKLLDKAGNPLVFERTIAYSQLNDTKFYDIGPDGKIGTLDDRNVGALWNSVGIEWPVALEGEHVIIERGNGKQSKILYYNLGKDLIAGTTDDTGVVELYSLGKNDSWIESVDFQDGYLNAIVVNDTGGRKFVECDFDKNSQHNCLKKQAKESSPLLYFGEISNAVSLGKSGIAYFYVKGAKVYDIYTHIGNRDGPDYSKKTYDRAGDAEGPIIFFESNPENREFGVPGTIRAKFVSKDRIFEVSNPEKNISHKRPKVIKESSSINVLYGKYGMNTYGYNDSKGLYVGRFLGGMEVKIPNSEYKNVAWEHYDGHKEKVVFEKVDSNWDTHIYYSHCNLDPLPGLRK